MLCPHSAFKKKNKLPELSLRSAFISAICFHLTQSLQQTDWSRQAKEWPDILTFSPGAACKAFCYETTLMTSPGLFFPYSAFLSILHCIFVILALSASLPSSVFARFYVFLSSLSFFSATCIRLSLCSPSSFSLLIPSYG